MAEYAKTTTVSPEKSRSEIERILTRWGADQFVYGWDASRAVIGFRAGGRQVRFELVLPDRNDKAFTHTGETAHRYPRRRTVAQAAAAYEQAVRQRWRALALVIKAKLEAVETGIATFESEFLAYIQLPNGQTVGEWVGPQLDDVYSSGSMPALMPGSRRG
jgi:hypothetical protein